MSLFGAAWDHDTHSLILPLPSNNPNNPNNPCRLPITLFTWHNSDHSDPDSPDSPDSPGGFGEREDMVVLPVFESEAREKYMFSVELPCSRHVCIPYGLSLSLSISISYIYIYIHNNLSL